MAIIVWDGDVNGNVYMDAAETLFAGVSDGVGTITIPGGIITPSAGDTIRVQNCDRVEMSGVAFIADVVSSLPTHFEFLGKSGRPLALTSSSGSPAPGDWTGIQLNTLGGFSDRNGPSVLMEFCTMEYSSIGLVAFGSANGSVMIIVRSCIFREMDGRPFDIVDLAGGTIVDVRHSQFIGCQPTTDQLRAVVRVSGDAFAPLADLPVVYFEYNTVLWRTLRSAGDQPFFSIPDRATLITQNNIITGENTDGAQTHKFLDAPGVNSVHVNNGYNFLWEYDPTAIALGDWVSHATDQNVDPAFVSSVCATPDLAPDGSVGSPALWNADSTGTWHPGAVEPFNADTLTLLSPVGTQAVYGERKQKIYTNTFGTSPMRGRAIRMKLRATDRQSRKLYAGIFVRHAEEEPK